MAGAAAGCRLGAGVAAAPGETPASQAPARTSSRAQPPPESPRELEVGGCQFHFLVDGEAVVSPEPKFRRWAGDAARMVSAYYGRFPVRQLTVQLRTRSGRGVGFGQHQDGRWVRVRVGTRATPETLRGDWVMVHEMLHAAFPDLARRHGWMQEGQATYLEPLVRAQAGRMSAAEVWAKWARMMPNGRPGVGDRGLDNTRTWGRLYWGGALFWMYVDLQARLATDNRLGLQAALRGVLDAGGNGRANWSSAQVIEAGDRALGQPVLAKAYAELARAPGDVDLEDIFARLGVRVHSAERVSFDDTAPWADIRRALVPHTATSSAR